MLERTTVSSPKTEDGGTGVGAGDCVQSLKAVDCGLWGPLGFLGLGGMSV